jgi:predicted DCC family thiol-disulfide oxidoreductase YuxK
LLGAATVPDYRRWAWLALALLSVANNDPVGVLLMHAFAFDPSWIPSSSRITPATLFYDGTCGLCHRTVRFLLSEDRNALFQLAPLQSPAFARLVYAEDRDGLPDSLVLRGRDGQLLVRSLAAIEIGTALGGLWRAAATLGMIVPPEVGDRIYDFVASRRRNLFAPPDASCPLVPPRLRARFVPDAMPDGDQPSEASAPR